MLRHLTLQNRAGDALRGQRNLNHEVRVSGIVVEGRIHADNAFGSDRPNFDGAPVAHAFKEANQPNINKISVFERCSGPVNHMTKRKFDRTARA